MRRLCLSGVSQDATPTESEDDHLREYERKPVAELTWHLIRDHGISVDTTIDTLDPSGVVALHEMLHRDRD